MRVMPLDVRILQKKDFKEEKVPNKIELPDVFYFAYGSNMDVARLKERGIIFYDIFPGKLFGWRLAFNKIADESAGTAYANIVPDEKSAVEGIIYGISILSVHKLDEYEGCPTHYTRERVLVKKDNQDLSCLVYIAAKEKTKEGLKPTKEYLEHLLKGRKFLSKKYYEFLKAIETVEEDKI